MAKMLGVCGLDCAQCEAYLATINNDQGARVETARKWSKEYGHPMKPEDVNCVGCNNQGVHIDYRDVCEIRKCGQEKKVSCCKDCREFASCEKIQKFHQQTPEAKVNCQG